MLSAAAGGGHSPVVFSACSGCSAWRDSPVSGVCAVDASEGSDFVAGAIMVADEWKEKKLRRARMVGDVGIFGCRAMCPVLAPSFAVLALCDVGCLGGLFWGGTSCCVRWWVAMTGRTRWRSTDRQEGMQAWRRKPCTRCKNGGCGLAWAALAAVCVLWGDGRNNGEERHVLVDEEWMKGYLARGFPCLVLPVFFLWFYVVDNAIARQRGLPTTAEGDVI